MKNRLIIVFLLGFSLAACNWGKPEKGKYILRTRDENGWENEIPIEITQSRINHITIVSTSNPYYSSSATLDKKGKKVSGNFSYNGRSSHGGSIETYRLDGRIISGNHRNTINGTYTSINEYVGAPGPSTTQHNGTFIISPE